KVERAIELAVDLLDPLPRRLELEPGGERLHPQVVLLVHHDADRLVPAQADSPRALPERMLAADQMPLDQELPIEKRQIRKAEVRKLGLEGHEALADLAFDVGRLARVRP